MRSRAEQAYDIEFRRKQVGHIQAVSNSRGRGEQEKLQDCFAPLLCGQGPDTKNRDNSVKKKAELRVRYPPDMGVAAGQSCVAVND